MPTNEELTARITMLLHALREAARYIGPASGPWGGSGDNHERQRVAAVVEQALSATKVTARLTGEGAGGGGAGATIYGATLYIADDGQGGVGGSTLQRTIDGQRYTSTDGGATWQRCDDPPPGYDGPWPR